jgi:hypothetical protein
MTFDKHGCPIFDAGEQSTTWNALRIAAERYEEHAKTCAALPEGQRLVEQFERQAKDARKLMDELSEAWGI